MNEGREKIIYTYGEGDSAADRLALVAELFEGASRSLLSDAVGFRPRLALDLGCGVGHTTRLLAEVLRPVRVVGVERSANFLSKARVAAPEEVSFVRHDVTWTPLPHSGEADLIYARLLLSHLPDPEEVAKDWLAQLAPGGLLLLEEVERIETEQPVFREYLRILAEMMTHHGQELYVGPRLEDATRGPERRISRVVPASPTTAHVARMFSINLANWRGNDFVRANHTKKELDRLAEDLSELTESRETAEIRWGMRQIAIERALSA
ncbi:MAG TPA: class I SAM-dependent methyltransferase [Rubrobacter sp.]|nr:class I SAM-dependent methyltransferase [Rubrobacter sp.]